MSEDADDNRELADSSAENSPTAQEAIDSSYRRRAWAQTALILLTSFGALSYGFSPEAASAGRMLPVIGATYLVLAMGACLFLYQQGELRAQLAPQRLDITIGGLIALVLYMVMNLVPLFALRGRPEEGWLWRLYLQLGDPREAAAPYIGLAILAIAGLEEIVWRGWMMRALKIAHGARAALFITTALYGLAHVATLFTLSDPDAGLNPLVVAAALGCGAVFGAVALRFERVAPSIFAHAIFSWATVLFPLWRRM